MNNGKLKKPPCSTQVNKKSGNSYLKSTCFESTAKLGLTFHLEIISCFQDSLYLSSIGIAIDGNRLSYYKLS